MTPTKTKTAKTKQQTFAPEGWHTVTPRIFTEDPKGLVRFVKRVFAATGTYRRSAPTELRIGDSVIMISDASARKPVSAFLYVYVENPDATYRRALKAGARGLEEPTETPYGDRRCMVEDEWGNTWQVARVNSQSRIKN